MMKHRISAFLLAVLLAVTAAGCSAQEPEDPPDAGEQCRNRRAFRSLLSRRSRVHRL